MPTTNQDCIFPQEVRLGLVLYGGVSLAIYENGVAQELFRAVKGEGVYTFLKTLINSDIIVDIMSGTSAGGINGVMLSYALANDLDFPASADLWRRYGGIRDLLRTPGDPNDNSILDSQGYYQPHLAEAYSGMPPYTARTGDLNSDFSELDMFVTGTDVHGKVYTIYDDDGKPIDLKDHRQLFVLSYREGRKNNFSNKDAASSPALAKLSRITSCFPAAFEPVHMPAKSDPKREASDDLITEWGKLEHDAYFLDGGLLNNKPFTSTISAIYRRTATRLVDRYLIYVEPDPEHFDDQPLPHTPTALQAALGSVVDIPGYQSISSDLESVAEHNDKVKRYWAFFRDVSESLPQPQEVKAIPDVADFTSIATDAPLMNSYRATRLEQIRDRAVSGMLKEDGKLTYLQDRSSRRAGQSLVEGFTEWQGSGSAQDVSGATTLRRYDVYFRLRRLFHMTYRISYALDAPVNARSQDTCRASAAELSDLWQRVNHQIKVLEMLQFAMETTIDRAPIKWEDLASLPTDVARKKAREKWIEVQRRLNLLLAPQDIPLSDVGARDWKSYLAKKGIVSVGDGERTRVFEEREAREAFMNALRSRIKAATAPDAPVQSAPADGSDQVLFKNILTETDALEFAIFLQFVTSTGDDKFLREYGRFLQLDAYLFSTQRMSDMESLDRIRIARFSPRDAQIGLSNMPLAQKVCGKELGHFSGFLKRSWRANDIMWGRLDAACQLIHLLLTEEALGKGRNCAKPPELPKPEDLRARFPNSTADQLIPLENALGRVGHGDYSVAESLAEQLILAAQREIVTTEVPRVLGQAIVEQGEWNNFKVAIPATKPKTRSAPPAVNGVWQTGVKHLDRAVTSYAAERLAAECAPEVPMAAEGNDTAEQPLSAPPGTPGRWEAYFRESYAVGGESWKTDIPKPIMLEVIARALIRVRESLVASTGNHASKIQGSAVYKLFVKYPIDFAYRFARVQSTMPEWRKAVTLGLGLMCIAWIAGGAWILLKGGKPGWQFDVAYFAGAAVILGFTILIAWVTSGKSTQRME